MIADGFAQDWVDDAGVRHIRLDRAHGDAGNTPRAIGGMLAVSEGFDAICFLDADNWYAPNHLSTCLNAAATSGRQVDYVIARRQMVRDDGSVLATRLEDDDAGHIDTSCYFLLRGAFHTIPRWSLMPKPLWVLGDRVYRLVLEREGLSSAQATVPTVNYLCTWKLFYERAGEAPPDFAKPLIDPAHLTMWWRGLDERDLRIIDRLLGFRLRLD